jgi:DNA modification methylase
LRRLEKDTPFLDVIQSTTTSPSERAIAPHPSVKPQAFMRRLVRGVLPGAHGIVLDPFAGCATTLAACEATGIEGIGIEVDPNYYAMAERAIPALSTL